MTAPSIFANTDHLLSASTTYRAGANEYAEVARRLAYAGLPAMPSDIQAEVRVAFSEGAHELFALEAELARDALALRNTAHLFAESQLGQAPSPGGIFGAMDLLDGAGLLGSLVAGLGLPTGLAKELAQAWAALTNALPMRRSSQLESEQDKLRLRQSREDEHKFRALCENVRRGPLSAEQTAQLYKIMQDHTWWFAYAGSSDASGVDSPLSNEEARVAFFGLMGGTTIRPTLILGTDTGTYFHLSLKLINEYIAAHRPPEGTPLGDPGLQSWYEAQANLGGLMNAAPTFNVSQQVVHLGGYADAVAEAGKWGIGAALTVAPFRGAIAAGKELAVIRRLSDGGWISRADANLIAGSVARGATLTIVKEGGKQYVESNIEALMPAPLRIGFEAELDPAALVGDVIGKAFDAVTADDKGRWQAQAQADVAFGLQNVTTEVMRASVKDLIDRGLIKDIPPEWPGLSPEQQVEWAKRRAAADPSGQLGRLLTDLQSRVASHTKST